MSNDVEASRVWLGAEQRRAIGVVSVAVVLLGWEVAPRVGIVPASVTPPFSVVMRALPGILSSETFWDSTRLSAVRWLAGYGGGSLLGIVLGISMARSRILWGMIDPFLVLLYPIPKAALVLFLVIWFGSTGIPIMLVVGTTALLPVVVSTYHAAQAVDRQIMWSALSLGTSRKVLLVKTVLPASSHGIISGARIGIGISLFTLLGAELIIRQAGIGAMLYSAWDNGLFTRVWGIAFTIATVGFVLDWLFRRIIALTLPWSEGLH